MVPDGQSDRLGIRAAVFEKVLKAVQSFQERPAYISAIIPTVPKKKRPKVSRTRERFRNMFQLGTNGGRDEDAVFSGDTGRPCGRRRYETNPWDEK